MKRMAIALALLGVIICTAFVTSYLAESAIDETCDVLNECTQKEENETIDALKIKEAVSVWNSNKNMIYSVMFQEDFSEIEKKMAELECMSERKDFSHSYQLCAETELLLRSKKEEINVSFENVF